MDESLVEHIVEVDDYMSVTLKIPKVMGVLDLQGLMMKSKKLLNAVEVPIKDNNKGKPSAQPILSKEKINSFDMSSIAKPIKEKKYHKYSDEYKNRAVELRNQGYGVRNIMDILEKEQGVKGKYETLKSQVRYWAKERGFHNTVRKGRNGIKYTPEIKRFVIAMRQQGYSFGQIAEELFRVHNIKTTANKINSNHLRWKLAGELQ